MDLYSKTLGCPKSTKQCGYGENSVCVSNNFECPINEI